MFECTAGKDTNYTDNKDSLSTRDAGTGRLQKSQASLGRTGLEEDEVFLLPG